MVAPGQRAEHSFGDVQKAAVKPSPTDKVIKCTTEALRGFQKSGFDQMRASEDNRASSDSR
jgi:hypothetical protein